MATEQKQLVETIQIAMQNLQANLHTMTVAKITTVNKKTIECQCAISRLVNGEKKEISVFSDVPPIFLGGGGSHQAYPLAVGDYCLMFFTERCFDRWWSGDDNQLPAEYRMHDYSDGFALVGLKNLAGSIDIPDTIERIGDIFMFGKRTHTGDTEQAGDVVHTGSHKTIGNIDASTYSVADTPGWSGTFATGDSRTVTVVHGLITAVA